MTTITNLASGDTGLVSMGVINDNFDNLNTDLVAAQGDITTIEGNITTLGTEKLNVADYQNGTKVYGATSTGTDAYAVTLTPAPASYLVGMTFKFQADVGNTGASTLNINALGAKTIKKLHDQDLGNGDIEAGQIVTVSYDGTYFQMDSQLATLPVLDINGLTATTPASDDSIILYDTSVGQNRKATLSETNLATPFAPDNSYPAGETLSAGNVVFIENAPTTAQATSAQNIGDVTANTRISFPVFGSGVSASTLKLNLAKTGSPSVNLGVRIETDNAGSPSGTLVHANATGTVATTAMGGTEAHGATLGTTSGAITASYGVKIFSKYNNILYSVTKHATSTATRCRLLADSGTVLATAAFSGNTATFATPYGMLASTNYRIECDNSGGSYIVQYGAGSFPYNKESVNFTSGSSNGADEGGNVYNVVSIVTMSESTVTLAGSLTIPAGQKCHIVTFQGTYGSETVNASNYYKIGYYTNDSTTRGQKLWNGSVHSAMDTVKVPYTSSTLFQPRVLSKTDADYTYKIDWHGIAQEAVTAGDLSTGKYPVVAIEGVDSNQTGMTQGTTMMLSNTPGAITGTDPSTIPTYSAIIGEAKTSSKLQIATKRKTIVPSTNYKLIMNTERNNGGSNTPVKLKEAMIGFTGGVKVTFDLNESGSDSALAQIYVNGQPRGTQRSITTTWTTYVEDISVSAGDLIQLYAWDSGASTSSVRNFQIGYDFSYSTIGNMLITD